jgi:hypothetical protein
MCVSCPRGEQVRLCIDVAANTTAARKSLRRDPSEGDRHRIEEALWAEWQLIRSVRHPHLLQYYDCDRQRLHLYVEYAAKVRASSCCAVVCGRVLSISPSLPSRLVSL